MESKKDINHWCVLCGTGYHACDTCNNEKTMTPWRSLTDTISHYKIFMVLRDYNNKIIGKKKAQELLATLDLSGREHFKNSAKKLLDDINMTDSFEDSVKILNKPQVRKPVKEKTENKPESTEEPNVSEK